MKRHHHHRLTRLAQRAATLPRLAALATLAATLFIIHFALYISASESAGVPAGALARAPQRGLILVPDEAHAMTTDLAVKRLRSQSPIRLDLVDGVRDNRTDFKNYDLTIILGVTPNVTPNAPGAAAPTVNRVSSEATGLTPGTVNSAPIPSAADSPSALQSFSLSALSSAWTPNANDRPKNEDAWALKTISQTPLVIVATGNRPRAVLYAVWALADKLAAGDDISALAMQETPRMDRRYAAICATAYGGPGSMKPPINRHTLFMATLDELPRNGINGVFLCPGTWRVAPGPGPQPPPVAISNDGKISANPATLADWRAMVETIKAYDMDVVMTIEPFIPPSFNVKKVEQDYFINGKRPPGFLDALTTLNRAYMEKLLELLPGIDGFVLHAGVEGARYSGPNIKGIRMFLSGQNYNASAEAMSAYLKLAGEIAQKHNKYLSFWTHQYGINTEGINAMRRMLFNFPNITIIEEDFWPNSLWINAGRLPIMAYLPDNLRAEIDKHGNKLGFFETTDAETNGAGALPTAIGDCFAWSMREILKRDTEMVIYRLNLHDRTPYGTLWSVSGIQLEQAAAQLWQNPAPETDTWERWIRRMYGPAAAPLISQALANDRQITQALTDINGFHRVSKISAKGWEPQNGKIKRFATPSPQKHRAPQTPAAVESGDQIEEQSGYAKLTFPAYARQNKAAAALVNRSLDLIEQARPTLARADYAYLHDIYDCERILLEAVYRLSEASYAANLVKNNYDNNPDAKAYFERAIKALEDCAASKDVHWLSTERDYVHGNLSQELRAVAAAYRQFAAANPKK